MNRLLVATAGALLLAVGGCARTEEPPKQECRFEAFELSACDRSGLAAVKAEGIWRVNVTLENSTSPAAMNLTSEKPTLFGAPLTERRVEGETFFLRGDLQEVGYLPMSFVLAGCQSPTPERVLGEFRRCSGGEADLKGTFEAVRVTRLAGEQEASGVQYVSEIAMPEGVSVEDLHVANGYAYVTAREDGLVVFDVSDPAAPRKVAQLSPRNDVWRQVWVRDQTLYVSSRREGIILYDVSKLGIESTDPLKRISAVPTPGVEVWGLSVDQNRLYAMSPAPNAEVLIYDITTPRTPKWLGNYIVQDSIPAKGEVPVGGAVLDNRLYIAHWAYGLAVANVTDPVKPARLGRFGYENASSRSVAVGSIGGRTIVFESSEGWGTRVRALDVTEPANITEAGRFELRPESTASALTLVGTKLYVAHNQEGLRILDVSDPKTPRQVGYFNTWRETDPLRGQSFFDGLSGVRVPGDGYIYAIDTSRGLLIFREQG
jgi:hypothetical protein